MRSFKLILLFLFLSPIHKDGHSIVKDDKKSSDQDKVIRADKASFAEFVQHFEVSTESERSNKSFDKKIKGYGWLTGMQFNQEAPCFLPEFPWASCNNAANISQDLLRHCYRSKSQPIPKA